MTADALVEMIWDDVERRPHALVGEETTADAIRRALLHADAHFGGEHLADVAELDDDDLTPFLHFVAPCYFGLCDAGEWHPVARAVGPAPSEFGPVTFGHLFGRGFVEVARRLAAIHVEEPTT